MQHTKANYLNRCLATLCALVILLVNFTGAFVVSAEDAATTVTISSSEALITYSREYAAGQHNPNDTIQLAMTSGTSYVLPSGDSGYIPIGNASRPFNGTVQIADNAGNSFITDVPLFGTITTAAKTVNTANAVRELQIVRSVSTDNALFAQNVVNASGSTAEWKVVLKPDTRDTANITAFSFAGVVGNVGNDSKVKIEFTHDSVSSAGVPANVVSSSDVGLICCTLGENAELTFKINSANAFNVTSSGGNAGGVVGSMGDGSKLIADTSFTSVANVTSNAAYAGALVGSAENADIVLNNGSTLTLSKTVTGTSGAGGVYGYYNSTSGNGTGANADVRTFELDGITTDSNFTIANGTDAGVLAGRLEAENDVTITETSATISNSTFTKQVNFSGGTNRGGLIGNYSNTSLANKLEITNAKVKVLTNNGGTSGGAIGVVSGGAAYINVSDFRLSTDAALNGGVIGDAGTSGSFIDIEDTIDVDGSVSSGIVDALNAGVLRLAGTTDLSGATYSTAQLVGTRSNGLIYALGSGSDSGWTFNRGTGDVDDVGDWGEVLRLSSANGLAESDFFTVNMTAHTVTVAGHQASMGTVKDFIKTALNIQLNDQDRGALKFNSGSRSSTLLGSGSTLSFTADIDLSDTGIMALTRDDGTNAAFAGTLNGGDHTVTLAIGEPYGKSGNTTLTSANIGPNNYGTVIGAINTSAMPTCHKFTGLFAKVADGTVSDLTVDGYISLYAINGDYKVGGVAAQVSGSSAPITLSDVHTTQDIRLFSTSSATGTVHAGGAIGHVAGGTAGTAAISDCEFASTIIEKTNSGISSVDAYVGGGIGYVASTGALTLDFDNDVIAGSYDNITSGTASSTFNSIRYGGLIGYIAGNSGSFSRNVTLNNITVANTASIKTKVRSDGACAGAFLGCEWIDTNVTIGTDGSTDGVTIGTSASGTPSITAARSGSSITPAASALVGRATGHWAVYHVNVVKASITASNPSTFGFIVNSGTSGTNSALYLDLLGPKYNIANTTFSGTFNAFDEIVYNTVVSGKQIDDNGNGIVSIRIGTGLTKVTMTGTGCNTYQNQTTYGKNTVTTNDKTRYYYNLDQIRTKSGAADKLLLWSLNKYANSSIKSNGYFNNNYSNKITGTCNMQGYSYYPVKVTDGVTIQGATVTFYNQEIEDGESGTGNSDGVARSTHADTVKTQHYLMHQSLFLDYTASLTISVNSNTGIGLTLLGNVGLDEGKSGFLIRGTLGDTNTTYRVNMNKINLAGAKVYNRSSGDYSPLLINKIGKNVKLDLTTLDATAGSAIGMYPSPTTPVASSLIGDVGYATAANINLTFSDIKLDARSTGGGLSGLDTAYGTSSSIFDRATLLNSFQYQNGCLGEYNYEYSEDWTNSQHRVTYGKEVTTSVEYAGREDHYYDDTTHYTNPTDSTAATAYDFSTGFLPYVYTAYNSTTGYHEIKVNVKDVNLTTGCGQYNDPYQITDGAMLVTAAKIISGVADPGIDICLPTDAGTADMWCTNTTAHAIYKFTNGSFVNNADSSDTKDLDTVRKYLAGAYYSITSPQIELPSTGFVGFGAQNNWTNTYSYDCQYAFRGVIIGNRNIIINHSDVPLIKSANGCVVKDVTLRTDGAISVSQDSAIPFRYDGAACKSYGAVIGQVMGGDNIIDHVEVFFTVGSTNASFTFVSDTSSYNRIFPVGGYVGVIVNGGVIFRNMTSDVDATGLTNARCGKINSADYLYVNPIIGRVIAGYAFNETSTYAIESAKLNNGTKNYVIPDLNPESSDKLDVTASSASTHLVKIPDGQAFYILSCIVNSGAGSAAYASSAENTYPSLANAPWIAYRTYTTTRCANYDEVGTGAASDGDYATVLAQDILNDGTKKPIPYIIRQYTTKDGSYYRARSLCRSSVVSEIRLTGSVYDLPKGFRGIGGIYSTNADYSSAGNNYLNTRIQFNKLTGNNNTVNLAMSYAQYDAANPNTVSSGDNYLADNNTGFGLFNKMYMVSADSTVSDTLTNVIKDLTIAGSVNYQVRTRSGGGVISYLWDNNTTSANNAYYNNLLSVGGLAGSTGASFKLYNVNMGTLTIDGAKYSGGLIGNINSGNTATTCIIQNCGTTSAGSVNVSAGISAGGMIGSINGDNAGSGYPAASASTVKIAGTANVTKVTVDKVISKCSNLNKGHYNNFSRYGAGGLIGLASCGAPANTKRLFISDIIVEGKAGTDDNVHANVNHHATYPSIYYHNTQNCAGGVVGIAYTTTFSFTGVKVSALNVFGCISGGVIGYDFYNSTNTGDHILSECTVDGSTGSGKATIQAVRYAAGTVARIGRLQNSSFTYTVEKSSVENYTIKSLSTEEEWRDDAAVGTVAGTCRSHVAVGSGKTVYINISDFTAKDCDLLTYFNYTSQYYPNNSQQKYYAHSGTGGLIGSLSEGTNAFPVTGHNILINGLRIEHYQGSESSPEFTADSSGYICGNNETSSPIRMTGVSVSNTTTLRRLVGKMDNTTNVEQFGTGGYVVLADFDGDSASAGHNENNPTLYNSSTDYTAADPYVTVNPAESIGNSVLLLTSDGISPTTADLPIQEIAAGDSRYNIPASYASQFSLSKLSTYNYEQGTSYADNFAVLLIDDVSRLNTTNMINAYINLLANTNYDYSRNVNSDIFSVNIYKMEYNETAGGFVKVPNETANLKRDPVEGQFYMNIDSVDTAGDMFSLIDIAYYDPADTSNDPKIAYHLYIPALVKKMLTFDFEIATGSGTNYERDWYDDNNRFGKPLMENLGTPASIHFRYGYVRTYDEWTSAANNGDNMFWNYPKTLTLTKSSSIPDLPNDTILVLVDAASGGKPYYARFSQVYSNGVLSLAGFRETLDDNTSAAFTPCSFIDFPELNFTAAADNDGTLIVLPNGEAASNATVRAKLNGTDTLFRVANSNVAAERDAQHYTVSAVVPTGSSSTDVVGINEPYYISFFTDSTTSNVVYHYTISAPSTFGVASNPSRIQDADKLQNHEGTVHLILGNIFVQSGVSLTTSPNATEISIMNNNHRVTANMSSTVQLASALKSEVQGYLGANSGINVFHSFMLYLTRNDNDSSRKVIAGDPTVTGSYVISSENGNVAATQAGDNLIDVSSGTYAEIHSSNANQNINEYLVNGNGAVINASVTFDYATDIAVSAQFPNREDETNTSIGTTASCTSNIAYNRAGTSYSKIAAPANDSTGHSYYCKIDNRTAKLHYNVISDVFVGDYGPLGINPLDDTTIEQVQISTLANYDISDIEEKAQGYDMIRCFVKLYSKAENNYGTALNIPEYMSSVSVRGYDTSVTGYAEDKTDAYQYVFTLPRSDIESASALATSLEIPLDYMIYTGAPFEQAGHSYSNFKIKLTVELIKEDANNNNAIETLSVSIADNFLIYTNARVLPDYIE